MCVNTNYLVLTLLVKSKDRATAVPDFGLICVVDHIIVETLQETMSLLPLSFELMDGSTKRQTRLRVAHYFYLYLLRKLKSLDAIYFLKS